MNAQATVQWILIFGPLAISPGPANVLFAASGHSFGIRGSIPFWLGTNTMCVLQSLAIGLGLDYLISSYPMSVVLLKYSGIVLLLYLAFRFLRLSATRADAIKPLSFRQGVIVELFNAKYLLIPTIMFTQFYSPATEGIDKLWLLTAMLAALTMASNMAWVIGGKALTSIVASKAATKTQGRVFAAMLCMTAIWLAAG
jgi:threonine/homoserine/homoserine lactone efflux protein